MVLKQLRAAVEVYHHLPRYHQIFHTFFKYGFADMLKLVHLQKILEIKDSHLPEKQKELHEKPMPERFRLALEELGPTFVKFGQILSTRRDLVNEEYVAELSKLQDQVAPFPGEEAAKIVEIELGKPVNELFRSFDEKPAASASMAQVHKAALKTGEHVAVKVQRPGIAEVIAVDLAIMMDIARFLDKHVEEIAVLNPIGVVREFSKTIWSEQDFTNEAHNLERFAKQFRGSNAIRVPKLFPDYSTDRVMTMEFITGYRIDKPDELKAHHIDPVKLSERNSKLIFQQMFEFGFFHADPHPGNIAILAGGVTCLYDFGMMGTLSPQFREDIATMILGLVEKDHRMVTRALVGMSEQGYASDMPKLQLDVEAFADHYLDRPLKELKLGFVLNRLLDLLMRHKLRMQSDFYLGIKALTQVEALGALLNPELNFVRFGKPYATQVIEQKYDFFRLLKSSMTGLMEFWDVLKDLPADARDLYQKIRTGHYSVPIEHKINPEGFEPMRNTMNHIANRLSNTLFASALMICSSILILAGMPPKVGDVSLFGLLGLIYSTYMGIRLMFIIWKRGGL